MFRRAADTILKIEDWDEKIQQSEAYRQIHFAFGQNTYDQLAVMHRNYALVIFMLGAVANWQMISISLWLISATFARSNRRGYPAFALVLGSSSSQTSKKLAERLGKAVQPLRRLDFGKSGSADEETRE